VKRYGATTALDGIILSTPPGMILGVLGSNAPSASWPRPAGRLVTSGHYPSLPGR
jgi:hypothetical protein